MLKSLQMKLVLILMLLVIAVMAVVGTFLINSVTAYNIAEFQNQVANFFQHHSEELEQRAEGDQPVESMEEMLKSYTRALGLSNSRNFYIVDGETGQFVGSSEEREDAGGAQEPFTDLTPNMITAMGGEVGQQINALSPYFDVAMPLDGGRYVFAVVDNKTELNDLTWNIFTILLRSLMFGLAVAIMFSFILARTITVPVQNLTKMATRIAKGDFSQRPQTDSSDEIGTLTRTFGEMAQVLETTLSEVNGERNKLNTLFLHMADGMVAFDKNGHILHMNPAAQRMLGLTFDPQMTYTQVFPNLNIDDSDLGEDGKYIEIDYAANKRILKIFLAMFGTQDDDYSGVMAVLHDITEQTKLDSSRREFVANVSHELRTPLTNIRSYAETLADNAGELPPNTEKNFLGVILNESDRMTHIVQDLLTLSRFDSGRAELKLAPFPFGQAVQDVYNANLMEAQRHGHAMELDITEELPEITGDRERIVQVMMNVVSNSIKYTPDGGRIRISAGRQDRRVWMEVADNGIGIPKEDRGRIFERFYRVDKARSRESGGTGLGLSIAKEIIDRHEGTIELVDRSGPGLTVRITLLVEGPHHGRE